MRKLLMLSALSSALLLGGCATDPTNDPRSGGFFGGVRGLNSGDYDMRQSALKGERDQSLSELRDLREEGAALKGERRIKANEVSAQRRQLASLKARNQDLARQIEQLRRSRTTPVQRTTELNQKQQRLTRAIRTFESQLDRGQLSATQAEAKRLSLEEQYEAIKGL